MAKYTWVDKASCIACGACGATAPRVYGFDDDGFAEVIYEDDGNRGITPILNEELLLDIMDAQDGCPTASVKISNEPFA